MCRSTFVPPTQPGMACPQSAFTNQAGVFDLCSCSISKQDCATRYATSQNPQFNTSSCVQYPQWRTDDVGMCGWAGAPCSVENGNTNCCEYLPGFLIRRYQSSIQITAVLTSAITASACMNSFIIDYQYVDAYCG